MTGALPVVFLLLSSESVDSRPVMLLELVILLCIPLRSLAGPVSSPKSLPFAAVNAEGDSLAVGDIKTWIRWGGAQGVPPRYAVAKGALIMSTSNDPERLSGGLMSSAVASRKDGIVAIACSEIDSLVFEPSRTPFHPSGSWTRLQIPDTSLTVRRCGMLSSGEMAILFPLQKTLMLWLPTADAPSLFQIDSLQGKVWDLVPAGEKFLVLSDSGFASVLYSKGRIIQGATDWVLSALLRHPFGSGTFTDTTIRFAASSASFIKVDGTRVTVAQLNAPNSPLLSNLQTVFVNPCNDNQACPPTMSSVDDSWTLSGYYGHFVGIGASYERLNVPLAASKSNRRLSGVAIAHSIYNGTFLYIGNDDGDYGSMPIALASVSPSRIHQYLYPSVITPIDSLSPPALGPPWWPSYLNVSGAWKLIALNKATPVRVRVGD